MADEQIEVPVAFCPKCNKDVPVFIEEFEMNMPDAPEKLRDHKYKIVVCPECVSLLNRDGDINITYYLLEDLENVTTYKGETKDDGN